MFATDDCDGVTGISDLVREQCIHPEFSDLSIGILFTNALDSDGGSGTGNTFDVSAVDPIEVDFDGVWSFTFTDLVTNGVFTDTSVLGMLTGNITYDVIGSLSDGAMIGTLNFSSLDLGVIPHDDRADLRLSRFIGGPGFSGVSIFDPVAEDLVAFSDVDLQTIPLPAPALMLFSALGLTAGLRRFRKG